MNDAIVLLSISQIVCLGGLAYLYLQLQRVESGRRRRPGEALRGRPISAAVNMPERRDAPNGVVTRSRAANHAVNQAVNQAPVAPAEAVAAAAIPVAARMAELGVDVATMARRMNRSEEEVRLMLRRQAARS